MIIPPRERRPTESFEVEFCQLLKNYVPKAQQPKKVKKPKAKKAKATGAAKKVLVTGPKKGAKKGLVPQKAVSSKSLAALSVDQRVALARSAAAGLTRQQSATAAKLAEKGSLTHKWQYLNDVNKWADYAPAASVEVEKMYANWLVNPHVDVRCVRSGDWEYMVDFNAGQQQNITHKNHRIRQVQRIPVV
jgi:hypothetical protein